MRVDDTGEQVIATGLDVVEGLALSRLDDRIEDSARDQYVRLANAFFGDDARAADREICGRRPKSLR
jgi:hypothetical protein